MTRDPLTVAIYRSEQEQRQWVRIEDAQRQHDLSDGQIIDAWRKGRISPRVDVPRSDFIDDAAGWFMHLGDYPLQVDGQHLAQFSTEGEATITTVFSPVVRGNPDDWDSVLYTAPDGRCMVDYGRSLVLSAPINTRLGVLWISADEVSKLIERPAEDVMIEALKDAIAPEPSTPPKEKRLDAQIIALVRVIEGMGYDPMSIPDGTKEQILETCGRLHPTLFPPGTGALNAWREASKRNTIRHNQNRN